MAVAVIISLYKNDNPLNYRVALDSLISQTIGIDEIHIYQAIDGELPDSLEDVVSEYTKYFYKIIRITPNQGLANALNCLIESLEDETYVFRMDSDDIARKDRFEKQISFMDTHTNIGILGMAISEFYENGEKNTRTYPLDNSSLLNTIHKASPFAHPTVCFRQTALKKIKEYPTEYHLCEDIGLWFNAARLGVQFANLPDVGLDFRILNNFYTRRSYSKALSELKAYWRGITSLFGFSWRLAFPIARFISRLFPRWLNKIIYESSLRQKVLK